VTDACYVPEAMNRSLEGRHVVVTGAGGGLGPAVVDALGAAGAICHAPARRELDLTDEQAVTRFYAALPALWGSVHVAGGFDMAPVEATTLAALTGQWTINVVTAFLASREAVRRLRHEGGGRIVNVASRAALDHPGGKIAYVAAKSAVVGMTRALAAETRDARILVNAVLPDTIDTPANRAAMPDADHTRWTPPAAIARTIAWLVSPENDSVTGALVPV
jgi:NAD(P)-dependent dehydrogenase (short-subunit alcohol dehydrogenase family)